MANTSKRLPVYLEIGKKRTFACALDWPGWSRSGRDEAEALQALIDMGPRYGRVVRSARLGFKAPADVSALAVAERLKGSATTDFGAPGTISAFDLKRPDEAGIRRYQALLRACWRTFDEAVSAAQGKTLRKGPRGGGREIDGIVGHVVDAEAGYLSSLGCKFKPEAEDDLAGLRKAILEGLAASARGEVPAKGPRGGARWPARYFVRRTAWHIIDHILEIEDRLT